MIHSFEIEDAKKYGVTEAIILYNLRFWIEKNKANERHFYDGRYWTYNSVKAFEELFPYLTYRNIRSAIDNLIKMQVIITGNYNQSSYDRTRWFALFDLPELTNGFDQSDKTVNTDIRQIENITHPAKRKTKITLQQFLDECKEKNERPLKDYKGLWKYCEDVRITEEMIALAWRVFRTKYTSETHGHKEQKDWRATFLNYIKGNYLKLWWLDSDENYKLTTAGMQAKMEHGESR